MKPHWLGVTTRRLRRYELPDVSGRWVAVLAAQAFVLASYLAVSAEPVTAPRYLLYPFVWVNLAGWAVLKADLRAGTRRRRTVAAGVTAAYFLAMLAVAGFVGGNAGATTGWRVISAPPGWGPILAYQGELLRLYLVPFQVVGYAALSYLLYAALLDASRGLLSGTLGLVSCVGCTWSVVAPLVAAGLGGVSTLGTAVYSFSYDLTTLVFVVTVALLYTAQRSAQR